MKYSIYFLFFFFFASVPLAAQVVPDSPLPQHTPDTVTAPDTAAAPVTAVKKAIVKKKIPKAPVDSAVVSRPDSQSLVRPDSAVLDPAIAVTPEAEAPKGAISYKEVLEQNPYFNFFGRPVLPRIRERRVEGKEPVFYLLAALVLYFGLIKAIFGKYMNNLLAVFFRASLKQKQLKEQLVQSPLPSLLLNILFVLVAGLYSTFLLQYYQKTVVENFWLQFLYACLGIALIYLGKFLVIKFTGWVFNMSNAADMYIFVVFLVNKLLAMFLLPLLVLIAFSKPPATTVWITLSYVMIAITLAYRYISSYGPIRREIKVNQLHFFLYLCAFEVAPLLLIYKVLLIFLEKSV